MFQVRPPRTKRAGGRTDEKEGGAEGTEPPGETGNSLK